MRKAKTFMLYGLITLSLTACGANGKKEVDVSTNSTSQAYNQTSTQASTTEEDTSKATTSEQDPSDGLSQMSNPWSDCESLMEAEEIAGFSFEFRDVINCGTYYAKTFKAMKGMLEITYLPDQQDNPEEQYVIRQALKTDEDISGDYNSYSHDFYDSDSGVEDVRLRGSKNQLMVCSFDYGDYSYVIYPGPGDYNETFYIIGELTGVDPEIYREEPVQ